MCCYCSLARSQLGFLMLLLMLLEIFLLINLISNLEELINLLLGLEAKFSLCSLSVTYKLSPLFSLSHAHHHTLLYIHTHNPPPPHHHHHHLLGEIAYHALCHLAHRATKETRLSLVLCMLYSVDYLYLPSYQQTTRKDVTYKRHQPSLLISVIICSYYLPTLTLWFNFFLIPELYLNKQSKTIMLPQQYKGKKFLELLLNSFYTYLRQKMIEA